MSEDKQAAHELTELMHVANRVCKPWGVHAQGRLSRPKALKQIANPGACMRRGGFPVLKLLLALGLAAAAAKVYQDKKAADAGVQPAHTELPFKGKRR